MRGAASGGGWRQVSSTEGGRRAASVWRRFHVESRKEGTGRTECEEAAVVKAELARQSNLEPEKSGGRPGNERPAEMLDGRASAPSEHALPEV